MYLVASSLLNHDARAAEVRAVQAGIELGVILGIKKHGLAVVDGVEHSGDRRIGQIVTWTTRLPAARLRTFDVEFDRADVGVVAR